MPVEGCAFVCGILGVVSGVLGWISMYYGDTKILIPALVFAAEEMGLCIYVLAGKYLH